MVTPPLYAWLGGNVGAAQRVGNALAAHDIATIACNDDDPANADRWFNFQSGATARCPDALVFLAPRSLHQHGVAELCDYVTAVTYEFIALTKLAVQAMARARRAGTIVAVCDIAGVCGRQGHADVSAAAGALIGATKCLAKELGRQNISVNAVCHGIVPDLGVANSLSKSERQFFDMMGLARPGTIEHVVENIAHLIRNRHFMTGQVLHVDDGLVM
jgi:NAD(P)-dependent dehydrogenase (short-subunit alcohol dehydrogenase family)